MLTFLNHFNFFKQTTRVLYYPNDVYNTTFSQPKTSYILIKKDEFKGRLLMTLGRLAIMRHYLPFFF